MADHYQILVTSCSAAEATALASMAVESGLAACAQVHGPVTSTFRWHGSVEVAQEWVCTLKTGADRLTELVERLRAAHDYELPEIIALPIVAGDGDYLRWVTAETRPRRPPP